MNKERKTSAIIYRIAKSEAHLREFSLKANKEHPNPDDLMFHILLAQENIRKASLLSRAPERRAMLAHIKAIIHIIAKIKQEIESHPDYIKQPIH